MLSVALYSAISYVLAPFIGRLIFHRDDSKANVYYVSPDGSDMNPGTKKKPWRTPGKAFTFVRAGDTVYFKAGVYEIDSTLKLVDGGSPGKPITFADYPLDKERALFKADNSCMTNMIHITDMGYIHIKGLRAVAPKISDEGAVIRIDGSSHHIKLESIKIHHSLADAIQVRGDRSKKSVTDVHITGGEIYKIGAGENRGSINISETRRVKIKGVYVHDSYGDLIQVNRSEDTCIERVRLADPLEGGGQHEDALHIYYAKDVIIKNSVISSVKQGKSGIIIGAGEGIANSASRNITLIGNRVWVKKDSGAIDINHAINVRMYNNRVSANINPMVIANTEGDFYSEETDVAMYNNIFHGNGKWLYTHGGNITISGSKNAFRSSDMSSDKRDSF